MHGSDGRWNLEALLERTAQIPLAPTGKAKTEPRPGFPYIEATSGRINFKSGHGEEALRSDQCRFFAVAGFGKYMGRAAEGSTVAHRFELNDYGPAADQWNMAARADTLARYSSAIQRRMETRATRAAHEILYRQRQGMAGGDSTRRRAHRNSGEVEGQQQRIDRRLPALRHHQRQAHFVWRVVAMRNTVR